MKVAFSWGYIKRLFCRGKILYCCFLSRIKKSCVFLISGNQLVTHPHTCIHIHTYTLMEPLACTWDVNIEDIVKCAVNQWFKLHWTRCFLLKILIKCENSLWWQLYCGVMFYKEMFCLFFSSVFKDDLYVLRHSLPLLWISSVLHSGVEEYEQMCTLKNKQSSLCSFRKIIEAYSV